MSLKTKLHRVFTAPRSIRFSLTVWYALVFLAGYIIFAVSAYFYLNHMMGRTLEQNLAAEVDWVYRLVDLEKQDLGKRPSMNRLAEEVQQSIGGHFKMVPRNYLVKITSAKGQLLYESENLKGKVLYEGQPTAGRLHFFSVQDPDEDALRVAVLRRGEVIVQVAYSERIISSVLTQVTLIFSILVPVVLLLSFAGGWVLSGMVLRPINQISEMASHITASKLSDRIPVREVEDELGKLITVVNSMIARLELSFDQIKRFSMDAAHELRTPLTILKGEAELAIAKKLTHVEGERLAASFLEETVRMTHIIDDLLAIAKAEAGQIVLDRRRISMEEVIHDLHEDASLLGSRKNLAIELLAVEPAEILGDPDRIRQLLRNIVVNAVQYTETEGTITLSSVCRDAHVVISIADTGIGIPPESIDRVFDRFYRVDAARGRATGGSGLGLAIAKWIAESHDGSITVTSEVGKGSTFIITLPLAPAVPSEPAQAAN